MKPLVVLIAVFLVSTIIIKLMRGQYDFALSGTIAMSVMLLFTSVAHFVFTQGMSMMIPDFIPFRSGIVYLTGIIEIVAAIALLVPGLRVPAAWFLILFFLFLLPANIYAAINHVNYEKATFTGNGPEYLWFRIPLQIVFIVWTYVIAVKS